LNFFGFFSNFILNFLRPFYFVQWPGRLYYGCGLLRNNIVGAMYSSDIIVAGGMNSEAERMALDLVEVYNSATGQWEEGPALPRPLFGLVVVQHSSDIILAIGGGNNDQNENLNLIYSLSNNDLSGWKVFENQGFSPRFAHVAFVVPKIAVLCDGDEIFDVEYDQMPDDKELILDSMVLE
jgi:hypothetical protein